MTRCFLCFSKNTAPVPFDMPEGLPPWFRCGDCGSDTALDDYDPALYGPGTSLEMVEHTGGIDECERQVDANCRWFLHHHQLREDRTFLDAGCGDGAALRVMQELGWSVHGWDVSPPHYMGPHVTVGPAFSRWLFPRRYAAVLSRESLEHSPVPRLLLHELHGVCQPGGLVQVQTPVPCADFHPDCYRRGHLFLASPAMLRAMLKEAMLDVIEAREWSDVQPGQALLTRARR